MHAGGLFWQDNSSRAYFQDRAFWAADRLLRKGDRGSGRRGEDDITRSFHPLSDVTLNDGTVTKAYGSQYQGNTHAAALLAGRMTASLHDNSLAQIRRLINEPVRLTLLVIGFGTCFLLGLAYFLVVLYAEGAPVFVTEALFQFVILAGYAALWGLSRRVLDRWSSTGVSVLWTAMLASVLYLALSGLIHALLPSDGVPFDEAGYPNSLAAVVRMHVLSLLGMGFVFVLLGRLRELALFKRTRRSLRNWNWMIGLMALAALSAFMKPPESGLGVVQGLFIVPAVILMVVNAFRLSWIIFLSFKEKMICMGLALVLLVLLPIATFDGGLVDAAAYLQHYSYPLSLFATLAVTFGILYCTAALLSLLFHLPTTSDFQRKADEMAAMHALTHLVSQAFDAEKLADSIVASSVDAGSARAAWLVLTGPEDGPPRVVATHNANAEHVAHRTDTAAFCEALRRSGAPLLLDEAPADPRVHAGPGEGFDSLLAVPLIARETFLGVLFTAKDVMHGFEQDDVEAISMYAAQAALALDHARLFEEQLEKERIERELHIARTVQQRLLPGCTPAVPGLALCASSTSAQEVGGDYYDFLPLSDGRLAFIVADVSGKGTSAAFYMAELQGIFQSAARLAPAPVDFLCHANAAIGGTLEKQVFISVLYGVIDPAQEELVFARAGHCPVAAISLHGDARFLRPPGLGLGLDRGALFRRTLAEERVRLRPGDAFVLYTDGAVESRSAEGEEYGYDRLLRSLRTHRHEDADDLHAALLGDLRAFIGRDAYDDDLTLVTLKWHGLSVPARSQAVSPDVLSQTATLDSG